MSRNCYSRPSSAYTGTESTRFTRMGWQGENVRGSSYERWGCRFQNALFFAEIEADLSSKAKTLVSFIHQIMKIHIF